MQNQILTEQEITLLDQWWRASNYLAAGQLYLLDNPLLETPLTREQIKRKIVGHWGTVPGQNFIYTHLNRLICKYDVPVRSGSWRQCHGGAVLDGWELQRGIS